MAGETRDYGEEIGSGNGSIQPDDEFTKFENSWNGLKDGCGVVVYFRGKKVIAYSQTWNYKHPHWEVYLKNHLASARLHYGEAAFIVKRISGELVCDHQAGQDYLNQLQKPIGARRRRKKNFHFNQLQASQV